MEDIRWQQRFINFRKAFIKLLDNINYVKSEEEFDEDCEDEDLDDLLLATPDIVKQGLIQSFEFTHELAWKVMKDYAEFQGNNEIKGSRDAVLYAAQVDLLKNAHTWMEMMKSRNSTSHTYNEETANEIVKYILAEYKEEFIFFENKMENLRSGKQGDLFD